MENDAKIRPHPPSGKFSSKAALQNTVGVTKLMHQCTSMLREKMWNDNHSRPPPPALRYRDGNGSAQPDNALEAMGPVLESVLGSLTQEYERRLLLKDQEIKSCSEQLKRTQEHVQMLEQQIALGAGTPQLEYHMSEEQREEVERLRQLEVSLLQQMEGKKHENEIICLEYERMKRDNVRLEVTCKDYKEKILANEAIMRNYKFVQEENRRLYNQVQDLQGNIRVFCRVRPRGMTGDTTEPCVTFGDEGEIALHPDNGSKARPFTFDKVFPYEAGQEQVYRETQPLIRSVVDGFNVCIFAYGQTGSGKTHTMMGTDIEHAAGRGINYRALDDLFDLQHQRCSEVTFEIRVTMLEVYNEKVKDLLRDGPDRGNSLEIRQVADSATGVKDLSSVKVERTQDVLDVMEKGQRNRATADTKMNERSSRSHSVLTVSVQGINTVTGTRTHGRLHLVDLAGSERVAKSEAVGDRLEEAKFINKSLSSIGDVMTALATKSKHVPFRNSKLTHLLQDSLQGQAKVMMFIHISPEKSSFGESMSTLGFGQRVAAITLGQAKKNIEAGSTLDVKEAQKEMQAKVQQLSTEMLQRNRTIKQEREEAEKARAVAQAATKKAAMLEAQMAEMQASLTSRKLYSDESAASNNSASTSRRTPRHPGIPRTPESRSSLSSAPGTAMTAEERHIQRMRQVMQRRETASGLPQRPRTAIGATSVRSSFSKR